MSRVLWIVNHYATTPDLPGGTRHYWLSHYLREADWDARVIAAAPTSAQADLLRREPMTWVSAPWPGSRGPRRIASWAVFSTSVASGFPTRNLPAPDVVLGSTVHLGAALAALAVARRRHVPFVFEVRDLWPETLIALGALRRDSLVAKAMLRIEHHLATHADLIVSPLSNATQYFSRFHRIPESRVLWLSNGVNLSDDEFDNDAPEQRDVGSGDAFHLQYFGSLGRTNYVHVLLRAVALASELTAKELRLTVYGAGPLSGSLSTLTSQLGIGDRVDFLSPIPQHQVRLKAQQGDALAFVVGDHPDLYRYGISMNKMFDYLAAGRWIVMAANVPFNPVSDAPGSTITDTSPTALARGLAEVAELPPDLREAAARANRALARERYDYRHLAKVLANRMDGLGTPSGFR